MLNPPWTFRQLRQNVAKMVVSENRSAEYVVVFEQRKRKKPPFAAHYHAINDTS